MDNPSQRLSQIVNSMQKVNEYGLAHRIPGVKLSDEDKQYLRENYGIDKDNTLHDMCINCQALQLVKYWGQTEGNEFKVRCTPVKKSFKINKESLDKMTEEHEIPREKAIKLLKASHDPVSWAEMMFGFDDSDENWRLRDYQKEQLRCTALRSALREGRRTGKTFISALKILNLAFNKIQHKGYDMDGSPVLEGPEIIIITPYQSQLVNIFNEMQGLLRRSPGLLKEVTSGNNESLYVKTPTFKMVFANGASIRGFVSGVGNKSDGSAGGTIRGASASVIYVDEMDLVPETVLRSVVMPILLTTPDVVLMATSTPIGKRGQFYTWCLESPNWKEDHLPSSVLPHWDVIKEEVEKEGTGDAFLEEYMAVFRDGSHGVFKPSYVYSARKDYQYKDCNDLNWWAETAGVKNIGGLIKVIGVDWNKNNGTEFVVVAYDPSQSRWTVVESTNIPASNFSSIVWKEEVIRLNYKWKPDYIYADEGYGHTIIEDLKLLAYNLKGKKNRTHMESETEKLSERLISFSFSKMVELRDPVDGTTFKKYGKNYIVENAVRIFEDEAIWFPEEDEIMKKQLLNYVILGYNKQTQKPIYGVENKTVGDHRLDALMLALAGLAIEYSIYSKNSNIASSTLDFVSKEQLDIRSVSKKGASAIDLIMGGGQSFVMDQNDFVKDVLGKNDSKLVKNRKKRSAIIDRDISMHTVRNRKPRRREFANRRGNR